MDENQVTTTPKEALANLFKSVKTPLIWFGIGYATAYIMQLKKVKRIAA